MGGDGATGTTQGMGEDGGSWVCTGEWAGLWPLGLNGWGTGRAGMTGLMPLEGIV